MLKGKPEKNEQCRGVEQHIQTLRNLLYGQRVVALDTCILGELEQDMPPAWLKHFQAMRDDGVRFVIPDLCVGERLECFANANPASLPVMKDNWARMASRLDSIIWRDLPCLPLRGDLFDIVGIGKYGLNACRECPFTRCTAQKLYEHFHDYENSRFNSSEYRMSFEEEIEKVRSDWKDKVLVIRAEALGIPQEQLLPYILAKQECAFSFPGDSPEMIELPFRFLVERVCDLSYCSPDLGKRTKNDGLDFQMLYLTMASINVCSMDRFFQMAHELDCARSCCCHSPDTLFSDWQAGSLPIVEL